MTGLSPSTTYYARSYATNANGTSYGNQVSFSTNANFTIGQTYGGGIIFYIDGTGQHGLIAATANQTTSAPWNNGAAMVTNATGLAIGTGANNTSLIITKHGTASPYAATMCRTFYNGGGYNDWYLPSLFELQQLFLTRDIVGGFQFSSDYWSSSEASISDAWMVNFGDPGLNQRAYTKMNSNVSTRAIRSF